MAGSNLGGVAQAKYRGDIISLPMSAATIVYRNTLVALDLTVGGATQAADTPALLFVGAAEEHIDNTLGAATLGALNVRVRTRGLFRVSKSAVNAATDIGSRFYAKTAQTSTVTENVDLRGNVSGFCPVGSCTAVEPIIGTSHYIWLQMQTFQSNSGKMSDRPIISLAANTTLSTAQTLAEPFVLVDAHAITVPAASAQFAGKTVVCASTAGGTFVCAAGFGGGGTGTDVATLAQGLMAIAYCDGTNWYVCNVTAAA